MNFYNLLDLIACLLCLIITNMLLLFLFCTIYIFFILGDYINTSMLGICISYVFCFIAITLKMHLSFITCNTHVLLLLCALKVNECQMECSHV